MNSQGYSFDHEKSVWIKEGYPDMMGSIVDYYLQNESTLEPIYMEDPNNPGETILDIVSMKQIQEILDNCGPPKYRGFAYGLEYSNGTHYIDNNSCKWQKIEK